MAMKALSVRIDEELLHKLHVVATYEERSINGQVLMIIKQRVEQYEAKYGKIELGKRHESF